MTKRGSLGALFALALCAVCGCFTTFETDSVAASPARVPAGKDIALRLSGFTAQVTDYVSVRGYGTVTGGGWYGRDMWGRPWGGPEFHTVVTETLVPQTYTSDAFLKRAASLLEESGFTLKAKEPRWLVEVEFSAPARHSSEDETVRALWLLCSLLSCDYGVQTRTAKLKIYDNTTGKLVHTKTFVRRHQVTMWSPIPFFGPASYDRTDFNYLQFRCLSELTDRCVEEIAGHLAPHAR